MNDVTDMLLASAERVFAEQMNDDAVRRAEQGTWLAQLWQELAEFGAPLMLLGEQQGGFDLPARDAFALVRLAASHRAPLPLAETMLGNWLLAEAGLPVGSAPITIVEAQNCDLTLEQQDEGWHVSGTAKSVPWGRFADLIAVIDGHVVRLDRSSAEVTQGANLAGHPRDDLGFDGSLDKAAIAQAPSLTHERVEAAGAAMRSAAIAGALERVLDMAVTYANDRVQFGRPIGKFQAVQQNLARLAGESVAANGAVDLAAAGFADDVSHLRIAAAKARAGEAAGQGAAIAHQIFAAIGFTEEHSLNHYTRPLWSWRDEFGSEAYWNRQLGAAAVEAGPEGLWPMITELS